MVVVFNAMVVVVMGLTMDLLRIGWVLSIRWGAWARRGDWGGFIGLWDERGVDFSGSTLANDVGASRVTGLINENFVFEQLELKFNSFEYFLHGNFISL